jgi:hypothetical protein
MKLSLTNGNSCSLKPVTLTARWDTKAHEWTPLLYVFVSHNAAARVESRRRVRVMVSAGGATEKSVEGRRNVTRSGFLVSAGCGIAFPMKFQPCKSGDTACVRGPLGAFYFIYNIVFFNLESA